MRIKLRTDGAAQSLYLSYNSLGPQHRAGDQIGVSADIFGQRIDRKIGAVIERLLIDGPEQGVVAGDDRAMPLPLFDFFRNAPDGGNIDNTVGRVCWRFNEDHRNTALANGFFGCLFYRGLMHTIGKSDG